MSAGWIIASCLVWLLLTWGIHYTAWQDGRLAGLAEADRRNRWADDYKPPGSVVIPADGMLSHREADFHYQLIYRNGELIGVLETPIAQ